MVAIATTPGSRPPTGPGPLPRLPSTAAFLQPSCSECANCPNRTLPGRKWAKNRDQRSAFFPIKSAGTTPNPAYVEDRLDQVGNLESALEPMPTFTSVNPAPCQVGPPHVAFYRSTQSKPIKTGSQVPMGSELLHAGVYLRRLQILAMPGRPVTMAGTMRPHPAVDRQCGRLRRRGSAAWLSLRQQLENTMTVTAARCSGSGIKAPRRARAWRRPESPRCCRERALPRRRCIGPKPAHGRAAVLTLPRSTAAIAITAG